jgi:hypothetical protein
MNGGVTRVREETDDGRLFQPQLSEQCHKPDASAALTEHFRRLAGRPPVQEHELDAVAAWCRAARADSPPALRSYSDLLAGRMLQLIDDYRRGVQVDPLEVVTMYHASLWAGRYRISSQGSDPWARERVLGLEVLARMAKDVELEVPDTIETFSTDECACQSESEPQANLKLTDIG